MHMYRVDSEKNERLKFEFFGLAHSLTIQSKYKNLLLMVLFQLLFDTRNGLLFGREMLT